MPVGDRYSSSKKLCLTSLMDPSFIKKVSINIDVVAVPSPVSAHVVSHLLVCVIEQFTPLP